MTPKNRKLKEYELKATWDSFESLLRDDLERLDYRTRAMYCEMTTLGVPHEMVKSFVSQKFSELWEKIAEEGYVKYDKGRTRRKDVAV
jgi:hypothetical protein